MSVRITNLFGTAALSLFILASIGCYKKESRWDAAQQNSEGRTAQESSAGRLENGDSPTGEDLGGPPPHTPGESGGASGKVTWSPKAKSGDTVKIDLEALKTGDPFAGGEFNKFFPPQEGKHDMVAKQEKSGFSQYSLRLGGEEIGQLSITDLRSNPGAAAKFETPDMRIAEYPAKKDGSKGTTLLVAGRFQVKVRSPEGNLNEQDRVKWLQKFDLAGLAALAN